MRAIHIPAFIHRTRQWTFLPRFRQAFKHRERRLHRARSSAARWIQAQSDRAFLAKTPAAGPLPERFCPCG